jgi:hypothetical protein
MAVEGDVGAMVVIDDVAEEVNVVSDQFSSFSCSRSRISQAVEGRSSTPDRTHRHHWRIPRRIAFPQVARSLQRGESPDTRRGLANPL